MTRRTRSATIVLMLPLLAGNAQSAPIHVDNELGSDARDGTQPQAFSASIGPLKSIRQALRKAGPGDTIVLRKTQDPYRESIVMDGRRLLGHPRFPIVIDGGGATWTGLSPIDPSRWIDVGNGLYQLDGPTRSYNRLSVANEETRRVLSPMLRGDTPMLNVGEYALWQGQLYYRAPSKEAFQTSLLSESERRVGLVLFRSSHVTVRNVRFEGFAVDAVQVRGPIDGIRFEECQFVGNGRSGIASSTNSTVECRGCSFPDNGKRAIVNSNYSSLKLVNAFLGDPALVESDPTSRWTQETVVVEPPTPPRRSEPTVTPKPKEPRATEPREPDPSPGTTKPAEKRKGFFDP